MSSRTLPEQMPDLEGLRVLVVGLGKSGLAAARLAASHGARVLVTDRRSERELGAVVARARDVGATVHAGGHPPALAAEADLIVISPGVPPTIELLEHARRFDLPIWGEVELAAHFCRGRVVGVTGSNGKSTVTALAGHVLRGAGVPGGTGGNLETPFADLLALDGPDAVHAVELSSFQLETVEALRPEVAIVLNLSPDHLDRYPSLEAYGQELGRIRWVRRWAPDGAALRSLSQAFEFLLQLLTSEFELDALSAELADCYESINLIYDLSDDAHSVATSADMCEQLLDFRRQQGVALTAAATADVHANSRLLQPPQVGAGGAPVDLTVGVERRLADDEGARRSSPVHGFLPNIPSADYRQRGSAFRTSPRRLAAARRAALRFVRQLAQVEPRGVLELSSLAT